MLLKPSGFSPSSLTRSAALLSAAYSSTCLSCYLRHSLTLPCHDSVLVALESVDASVRVLRLDIAGVEDYFLYGQVPGGW